MKSLNSINTLAFKNCVINKFDAPQLNSIIINRYDESNYCFTVGTKNF